MKTIDIERGCESRPPHFINGYKIKFISIIMCASIKTISTFYQNNIPQLISDPTSHPPSPISTTSPIAETTGPRSTSPVQIITTGAEPTTSEVPIITTGAGPTTSEVPIFGR